MIDLQELQRLGIRITQMDGKLKIDAPAEVWTEELREQVREQKRELANALEAGELRFHLEFTLVYTSRQTQRSRSHGVQHRRALKLWRERECALRNRGFDGCIRGDTQRCLHGQELWCCHCRLSALGSTIPDVDH